MALKNCGALWKGKPGSKALLTGNIEIGTHPNTQQIKIMMFKNDKKDPENPADEKKPDYRLVTEAEAEGGGFGA